VGGKRRARGGGREREVKTRAKNLQCDSSKTIDCDGEQGLTALSDLRKRGLEGWETRAKVVCRNEWGHKTGDAERVKRSEVSSTRR